MVEMAITLPLFIMFVFMQVEIARACMVSQLIANAAREGARVAVLADTTSQQQVLDRVNQSLQSSGVVLSQVSISPGDWATSSNGTPITVTLNSDFQASSWGGPILLNIQTLTASSTFRSERP